MEAPHGTMASLALGFSFFYFLGSLGLPDIAVAVSSAGRWCAFSALVSSRWIVFLLSRTKGDLHGRVAIVIAHASRKYGPQNFRLTYLHSNKKKSTLKLPNALFRWQASNNEFFLQIRNRCAGSGF
eukprot:1716728-Amphidinium_carterae.1